MMVSFIKLLALSQLHSPGLAYMHFSEEPHSCQVIGDSDLYGIGVRLGFYLQWASLLICRIFKLHETASSIMTSQIILVIAIVINAVAGYRVPGTLVRYEVQILFLELAVFIIPLTASIVCILLVSYARWLVARLQSRSRRTTEIQEAPNSDNHDVNQGQGDGESELHLARLTFLAIFLFAGAGIFFAAVEPPRLPQDKLDCQVWLLNSGLVNVQNFNPDPSIKTADSGESIARIVVGIIFLVLAVLISLLLLWWGWKVLHAATAESQVPAGIPVASFRYLRGVEIAALVIFGPIFIGLTEYQIRGSGMDVVVDFTQSSGQLIPFVGGILGVALTSWALLKKLAERITSRLRN